MNKKKIIFTLIMGIISLGLISYAKEDTIKIEVPSTVEKIDIKYQNKTVSNTEKVSNTAKNKAEKAVENTKLVTDKAVSGTKTLTQKTVETTKSAAKKTAAETKNITNKAIENTKDIIDDINISKEVTFENLEKEASIKKLKNEKKALKSAYNSRIKDTKAKIKQTQQSTIISDVQKQNKIYKYEKQIDDLELQKESAIKKYNARISELKQKNK